MKLLKFSLVKGYKTDKCFYSVIRLSGLSPFYCYSLGNTVRNHLIRDSLCNLILKFFNNCIFIYIFLYFFQVLLVRDVLVFVKPNVINSRYALVTEFFDLEGLRSYFNMLTSKLTSLRFFNFNQLVKNDFSKAVFKISADEMFVNSINIKFYPIPLKISENFLMSNKFYKYLDFKVIFNVVF